MRNTCFGRKRRLCTYKIHIKYMFSRNKDKYIENTWEIHVLEEKGVYVFLMYSLKSKVQNIKYNILNTYEIHKKIHEKYMKYIWNTYEIHMKYMGILPVM